MNGPVKLREFLRSPAAKAAKELNDKLSREIQGEWCPNCGYLQETLGQRHECKGVVVSGRR